MGIFCTIKANVAFALAEITPELSDCQEATCHKNIQIRVDQFAEKGRAIEIKVTPRERMFSWARWLGKFVSKNKKYHDGWLV